MKPIRIITCIKQVPGTTQVDIDEVTGNLKRDGIENKMNMYDLFSIETALSLTEKHGGSVHALTMGPPQAKAVLLEAYYMGVASGTLICDPRFAGSDVLATAYTLAQAVSILGGYDLILCGKQTTDGDTAQVGSELAEILGIPHASGATAICLNKDCGLTVFLNRDDYVIKQQMPFPCLLCMDGDINTPRLPSFKRKRTLPNGYPHVMTLDDFKDNDETHYGISGSPTQVEAIFPPEKSSERKLFNGNGDKLGEKLADILIEKKMIL